MEKYRTHIVVALIVLALVLSFHGSQPRRPLLHGIWSVIKTVAPYAPLFFEAKPEEAQYASHYAEPELAYGDLPEQQYAGGVPVLNLSEGW